MKCKHCKKLLEWVDLYEYGGVRITILYLDKEGKVYDEKHRENCVDIEKCFCPHCRTEVAKPEW